MDFLAAALDLAAAPVALALAALPAAPPPPVIADVPPDPLADALDLAAQAGISNRNIPGTVEAHLWARFMRSKQTVKPPTVNPAVLAKIHIANSCYFTRDVDKIPLDVTVRTAPILGSGKYKLWSGVYLLIHSCTHTSPHAFLGNQLCFLNCLCIYNYIII